MTTPDPPWKKKTRPCPFYSQGRCLFADSCNFLHEVKVKVRPTDITTSVGISVPGITLTQSPTESNASVPSPSTNLGRLRSPPRSPRLSSLLLALGDAIAPDEGGDSNQDDNASRHDFTDVSGIFGRASQRRDRHVSDPQSRPVTEQPAADNHHHAVELSSEEAQIAPAVLGPVSHASGTARNTGEASDLLSPIEVALAPPAYWRLGQLDTSMHREDSVDSGYAEWTEPKPFALSPPRSPSTRRLSTLDLLSSPFGTPARVLSPKFLPSSGSEWPASPRVSLHHGSAAKTHDISHDSKAQDDLDSPSAHRQQGMHDTQSSHVQSESDFQPTVRPDNLLLCSEVGVEVPIPIITPRVGMKGVLSELKAGIDFLTDDVQEVSTIKPSSMAILARSAANETENVLSAFERPELAYIVQEVSTIKPSSMVIQARSAANETENAPSAFERSELAYMSPLPAHVTPVTASIPDPKSIHRSPSPHEDSRITQPSVSAVAMDDAVVATASQSSPPSSQLLFDVLPTTSPLTNPHQISLSSSHPASPSTSGLPSSRQPQQSPSVVSRQSSMSDGTSERRQSRASQKVPFGFRHSMSSRSRESSVSSRHSSTSRTSARRRPPGLINLQSALVDETLELATPSEPSSTFSKLKPLRLSVVVNAAASGSGSSTSVSPSLASATASVSRSSPSPSASVSSSYSTAHNRTLSPLSSVRPSLVPSHTRNTPTLDLQTPPSAGSYQSIPHSAPLTNGFPQSGKRPLLHKRNSVQESYIFDSDRSDSSGRPITPLYDHLEEDAEDEDEDEDEGNIQGINDTICGRSIISPSSPRPSSRASIFHEPAHAIATPRPTLLFAIARDNVDEVRRVLESGEAGPNDDVGPQSALAFALTAEQLKHRVDIVKVLLAHGASPSLAGSVSGRTSRVSVVLSDSGSGRASPVENALAGTDPATRYYIARANAPQTRKTSALIHRSFFRPLTKVRYDLIGQDRALEQLFRVLSMITNAPIVVLLCGPSGHGKSLLARKFGSLLGVPTHTVNMTTLRSTHDIWRSYSMSPYEAPSTCTLADFLMENEGKRCVVVLDEIEKTENEKILSSLLMPWELGRCSFEAGHRHVDASKVIWLGTSNVGHDLVFEHQASRNTPEKTLSREEYIELMGMLRPKVSDRLGPSLLSRVTTVLPFVPFTNEEKMAIATEALFSLAAHAEDSMSPATVERLVQGALRHYVPVEGARSLYRAISTELLDML